MAKQPAPRKKTAKTNKFILNCLPSKNVENDWPVEVAEMAGNLRAVAAIPSSKDLRAPWWKIGNQGSTGSCVGWATADSVLRWHFVNVGRIGHNEPLSVRYIWMAAKETDEFETRPTTFIETDGTSLKAALDIARKFGTVKDSIVPFVSGKLYQGETQTFYAIVGNKLNDWRKWIANNGPILTRLDVDDTWKNVGANGKLTTYKANTKDGGHAVAIVGYTPSSFIIRNSWGTTQWGDKGFAYATNAYAAAAFTEAYGVTL